jgi:hypothetical protein
MRSARKTELVRLRYTTALVAVSLALLLQCLAPPGYMAGNLDNGWPVVLCPEGLPAGFLGEHGHHHHAEASGEDLSLDGYCPLGGILDASAELQALNFDVTRTTAILAGVFYRSPAPLRRAFSHPVRAPPTHV